MLVVGNTFLLNQIIPHLLTVANVAYLNVSVSNMMRTLGGILNLSPLGNVNNLLSSNTLFKFSAHSGSTSQSKTIQCLLLLSFLTLLIIVLKI